VAANGCSALDIRETWNCTSCASDFHQLMLCNKLWYFCTSIMWICVLLLVILVGITTKKQWWSHAVLRTALGACGPNLVRSPKSALQTSIPGTPLVARGFGYGKRSTQSNTDLYLEGSQGHSHQRVQLFLYPLTIPLYYHKYLSQFYASQLIFILKKTAVSFIHCVTSLFQAPKFIPYSP
jgi:hypothetical protein